MPMFRKKPVVIEAMRLTSGEVSSVIDWIKNSGGSAYFSAMNSLVFIRTMEGNMRASLGDWIIKGVQGEFYPCKPDIFEATYERADQ